LSNGTWKVTLDVQARKVIVDTDGVETSVPMDDLVKVGVTGSTSHTGTAPLLYRQLYRLKPGAQQIVVIVQGRPPHAGIDPRRLLIDVDGGDNVVEVKCSSP
jgi:hypothetical protein